MQHGKKDDSRIRPISYTIHKLTTFIYDTDDENIVFSTEFFFLLLACSCHFTVFFILVSAQKPTLYTLLM